MHDLVRDVCLREAQKDKFLCMVGEDRIPTSMSSLRRIVCIFTDGYPLDPLIESLEPTSSLVRTLLGKFTVTLSISRFRLLRVCGADLDFVEEESSDEEIVTRLANLRLILVNDEKHPLPIIPSWPTSLWNLQTLHIFRAIEEYVLDIWKMPLLRHVISYALCLPDPPLSGDDMDEVVLQNLQTLDVVSNLILSESVVKRIPNIRKLRLAYLTREEDDEDKNEDEDEDEDEEFGDLCLYNLHRLGKLQDLCLMYYGRKSSPVQDFILPYSLKKLTLDNTNLPWEEMASKIGCLPILQVLKLKDDAFIGSEWETVEGQFPSLKFLEIDSCGDLEHWTTESTHFPRLERLVLRCLSELSEVPSSIGDIPTLKSISLYYCSDSAVVSARRIQEEQEENGNELLLQILV